MFEAVYIKNKIYEHYIYIDQPAFCVFETIFDDFSLHLYKIDRDLKFLCCLPVCSHAHPSHMHGCACVYVHVHVCGGHPNPPTPTKNLKAQILLEAEIWHIMSLDAKLQLDFLDLENFLIKV